MSTPFKSLLSALYGIAIAEGRDQSFQHARAARHRRQAAKSDAGRKAGDRARSADGALGIYHPAAYETADIRQKRPARGSHAAGTFWFYNNWDFNALGAVYRQATGEDVFQSFAHESQSQSERQTALRQSAGAIRRTASPLLWHGAPLHGVPRK
jgi:CubicO group peptidase (beta-lactamase class C family)